VDLDNIGCTILFISFLPGSSFQDMIPFIPLEITAQNYSILNSENEQGDYVTNRAVKHTLHHTQEKLELMAFTASDLSAPGGVSRSIRDHNEHNMGAM
jgi:hypothetical protein